MTQIVFKHRGSVDKYMGDGITGALQRAVRGSRARAQRAVRTGLEFQERALTVSAKWQARLGAVHSYRRGHQHRRDAGRHARLPPALEYTALGDHVNLGSRLESATKDYGAPIIISEYTYAAREGAVPDARARGSSRSRASRGPVKIYGVRAGQRAPAPAGGARRAAVTHRARRRARSRRARPRTSARADWRSRACRRTWETGTKVQDSRRGRPPAAPDRRRTPRLFQGGGDAAGVSSRRWTPSRRPAVAEYVAARAGGRRTMRIDVGLGGTARLRTIIGSLLLMASVAGCAESGPRRRRRRATAQQECGSGREAWRARRAAQTSRGRRVLTARRPIRRPSTEAACRRARSPAARPTSISSAPSTRWMTSWATLLAAAQRDRLSAVVHQQNLQLAAIAGVDQPRRVEHRQPCVRARPERGSTGPRAEGIATASPVPTSVRAPGSS